MCRAQREGKGREREGGWGGGLCRATYDMLGHGDGDSGWVFGAALGGEGDQSIHRDLYHHTFLSNSIFLSFSNIVTW